jgi:hypothetical protein
MKEFRDILRLTINGALSDFLFSQDGIAHDPLELPPHAFALWSGRRLSAPPPRPCTENVGEHALA